MSAIALSENKVVIVYENKYLYIMICKINKDKTITIETEQKVNEDNAGYVSAIKLSENKIFIAYQRSVGGYDYFLQGVVCTIEDNNITTGTSIQINSESSAAEYKSIIAVALTETKVFIVYGKSYKLGSVVCTISDMKITVGTVTSLSTSTNSGNYISITALSEDKVFIAHSSGTNYFLYGIVCTISNTAITEGADTQLGSQTTIYNTSIVKLSDSKIFIAYRYTTEKYLYGMVCTISGTTITAGTSTQLSKDTNIAYRISAVLLTENKVFIAYDYDTSNYLYSMVCTISNTTITSGTDIQLSTDAQSGWEISAIALSENEIFIAHTRETTSYHLCITFINFERFVELLTFIADNIYGIANTTAQENELVDVYTPYKEVSI